MSYVSVPVSPSKMAQQGDYPVSVERVRRRRGIEKEADVEIYVRNSLSALPLFLSLQAHSLTRAA